MNRNRSCCREPCVTTPSNETWPSSRRPPILCAAAGLLFSLLLGCGGGGGSSGGGAAAPGTGTSSWQNGVFAPSGNFDALCVNPRSGNDPFTGRPYPDRAGSRTDQNNWLRSWSNELYLWYDEIVDRNPASYSTPQYFSLLKTDGLTDSGRPKDNFHFSLPTEEWAAYADAGTSVGYGIVWSVLRTTRPRHIRVGFVEPGSPADGSPLGLTRGWFVRAIDGIDIDDETQAGVDALNAALFPAETGETHVFTLEQDGTYVQRDFTLTSALITTDPVPEVRTVATTEGLVGYLLFNDHIATAEAELVAAIEELRIQGVDELVVDLRYNGGGYLAIASELAYMIAGPARTAGRTFELLKFNSKHSVTNPITGEPIEPEPFYDTALGFSVAAGTPLPTLDLDRVFLLTGPGTCSASESILNALRGIGVDPILIGGTTCGKPYGFYPADNCGTTYFTIQFQGVNDAGFGDYPDGFSPPNESSATGVPPLGVPVKGCAVRDDWSNALGDPDEARFWGARYYMRWDQCPPASASVAPPEAGLRRAPMAEAEALGVTPPLWRNARVMDRTPANRTRPAGQRDVLER
jgi:carboxyl-terminal processing protease